MAVELTSEYYLRYLEKISAKIGNARSIHGLHHRKLNAFIHSGLEGVPDGARILDAGCGLSIWVSPELRKRWVIAGVDAQSASIEACQAVYQGQEYRLGDLYALDYPDQSFAAVVMREVIEHVRHPELAVREVQRVLKPGGRFVLTTPNYDSLLLRSIEQTYNRFFGGPCKPYLDDVHPSRFRVATLRELIGKYAKIERYQTIDLGISLGCVASRS